MSSLKEMVGGVDSRSIGLHTREALTEESFTSLGFSMSWEEQFSLGLARPPKTSNHHKI